jgi:hypothetical protein
MNRNVPVPFLGEGQRQRWPLTRLKAVVPPHLKAKGAHSGRVLVRTRGIFDLQTRHGRVKDIPARYCRSLHQNDGYIYQFGAALPPHA